MFIRQRQALFLTMVSVCAVWMIGCSDESLDVAFSKKFMPESPTGVSAYASSSTGIELRWNSVSDALGYIVYRSEYSSGSYTQVAITYSTTTYSTSYFDNGLSPGTTYYYKVSAYNGSGESSQSSYVSATTPLNAPTNVSASANSASSILVSWSYVSGASGYYVYRSTDYYGAYSRVGSGTSYTSYTDNNLSSGTTYYYKVTAYKGTTESAQSSYASAMTGLNSPSGVSASANSSSSIYVSWNSVSGASGYYVYRSTNSSGTYSKVGSGTSSTSYTDNSVSSGTTYYYKVSAYSGTFESPQSSSYDYATTIPSAPSSISASANSLNSIAVSWYSSTGATGYYVYRSTDYYGAYSRVGSGTSYTSYTDNGLSAGTTYYYKVSAYNGTGESSQSSSYAYATTNPNIPSAPTGISANANSSSSISVSWNSVSGATGYYVYRNTSYSGNYSQVGYGTSYTSYTDYNVSAGMTYYYKVSAYNGSGEGSMSMYDDATIAPIAPTGISASATSSSSISVSWYSVTGATEYYVYRSTSSSGYYTQIGYVASSYTSYTDNSVSSGTTYYYRVSAYNNAGESSQSSYTSAVTGLDAPLIIDVTPSVSTNSISVSWYSVTGATGYYVYRSTSSSGTYTRLGSGTSYTSYTDNNLEYGMTYYYKVSAYNGSGEGSRSVYGYDATTIPSAPTSVQARCDAEEYGINVTWKPVTGATGYKVYRSTDNDDFVEWGETYDISYLDNYYDYEPYYYRVKAMNTTGASAYSLSSPAVGPCDY